FLLAERGAVRLRGVDRSRRGVGDVRADLDERGTLAFLAGRAQRRLDLLDVLGVRDALHVPAVGLHAGGVVLPVEGQGGRAVDRDAVVVVADDQLAEREVAGDR